ncbi:interferon-stimulated 20 kDa exonuclease-like 2 [Leptodactylus fuscus]|uniref:interferon-stimulated 20 kDa exonuclease-like 2 n=1 Tax=Leptodactylus fuscus TaxID=238119 RepID=UPI003F4F1C8D
MADLILNLDFSTGLAKIKTDPGSRKHRQFLRKMMFVKRKQQQQQQRKNSGDHSKKNGQANAKKGGHDRKGRPNLFHKQGAADTSSRSVTVSAPRQPGTLSVSKNCAPNHPPAKGPNPPAKGGAKNPTKPFISPQSLLSEYEGCLPSMSSIPSYKIVAIDCEMVGTGVKGRISSLARCSIVNYQGDVVYDEYVKPPCPVTDYRTRWSGIRREHLTNAVPFKEAQKEVLKLLHGKLVIGHAIQNDYKALGYFHTKEMTRDTSRIPLLNRKAGLAEREMASLKRLTKLVLNKDIQMGKRGHSSVEDARATMELYRAVEAEYEQELAAGTVQQ